MRRFALLFAAIVTLGLPTASEGKAKPGKRGSTFSKSKKGTAKLRAIEPAAPEPAQDAAPPSRGPTRIDFDDRLVQGQTNKSGAVYLYERKELPTRSMVTKRESFRGEIVRTVYDD